MAPFDYLTVRRQDLSQNSYRSQREWVDGRGILLPIAHFFSGIGAGAWVFSLYFDFRTGLLLSLIVVGVLSGITHLLFLGRLKRFWRMIKRPQSSWISRGLWGIALFLIGGTGYILLPETMILHKLALGVSIIGTVLILLYEGFVYVSSKGIPFWNTPLLPVLYIAYGLRGGAALLLVTAALGLDLAGLGTIEAIKLWVVVSTAVLILLLIASANRSGGAAKFSAHELVAGKVSPAFYGGTIVIGIVVPILLGLAYDDVHGLTRPVIGIIGVASLIGDFFIKYCIVRAGTYAPLTGPATTPVMENASQ